MTQTVLLAGATGMLGSQIAHHLLNQPEARLRLLVRGGDAAKKRAALDPLLTRGAEIIEGDLADRASLDRATQGVEVIVSAVQGGPDVIIDGQVALAEARAVATACGASCHPTTRSTCSRRCPANT